MSCHLERGRRELQTARIGRSCLKAFDYDQCRLLGRLERLFQWMVGSGGETARLNFGFLVCLKRLSPSIRGDPRAKSTVRTGQACIDNLALYDQITVPDVAKADPNTAKVALLKELDSLPPRF
jgi:hypothetical protein